MNEQWVRRVFALLLRQAAQAANPFDAAEAQALQAELAASQQPPSPEPPDESTHATTGAQAKEETNADPEQPHQNQ